MKKLFLSFLMFTVSIGCANGVQDKTFLRKVKAEILTCLEELNERFIDVRSADSKEAKVLLLMMDEICNCPVIQEHLEDEIIIIYSLIIHDKQSLTGALNNYSERINKLKDKEAETQSRKIFEEYAEEYNFSEVHWYICVSFLVPLFFGAKILNDLLQKIEVALQ